MDFQTAASVSIPAIFLGFLALEWAIGNGRVFTRVRFWTLFGIAGFVLAGLMSAIVPALVAPLLPYFHVFDLSGWGLWGALPTVILTTFFTYWSHRLQHRYDLLWRLGHQFHHSVVRVDVASGMIFHPIDLLAQFSGRYVRDKTGLTGRYDFDLKLDLQTLMGLVQKLGINVPTAALANLPQADGSALMTALKEQLGLKLDSARGPVDVLVVDTVAPATPD